MTGGAGFVGSNLINLLLKVKTLVIKLYQLMIIVLDLKKTISKVVG